MPEFNDLMREVLNIRNAINDLEVKGVRSAEIVVYINSRCNAALQMADELSKKIQNGNGTQAEETAASAQEVTKA